MAMHVSKPCKFVVFGEFYDFFFRGLYPLE